MSRVTPDVERGPVVTLMVDEAPVSAFAGETVAVAMLAAGITAFRADRSQKPRGLMCNMGTCSECTVWIADTGPYLRQRACLTLVSDGLKVRTQS